jgi:hypothetical protein
MGTGSFPGVEFGRGVVLTHHPLLVPRSKKSRGHSMSSEPTKKPDHLWFYSYLVNLKYHGRYEKLKIFIILYVVVFHL